ncbi:4-carboxymuconolactone decarboxylase [Pokkaliibacter plantistimulans]|uniref:4-carboxymuconolactone decarboxylase n=2 Tax=Pseudomonadota TaxID=1224 RepID=A0ABX5LTV0_9GAMM|nr:4-carboxymuconolactone decarboxylase [Pokkaliibacter plantistimulans]PPC78007.1 4-carboxymuconolactone decarboxylase [Pokkaliibacter plantistimulans]PXF29761.1 4-carboxymuconolactone decarboxylase [Pokkaliibacter plantistimulans]
MSMQSRLTPIADEQLSPAQQQVLQDILSGPRGNLDGPFLAWIHSPGLAQPAQQLGAFCRYHTRLSTRLSELAILLTASRWQSQAEWLIHEPIALKAGLSAEVVDALRQGQPPVFSDPEEALIYAIGQQLYDTRRVSDALYQQGVATFGEPALVELVGIFGYYALVAMTLNVFAMRPQGEHSLPFPEAVSS